MTTADKIANYVRRLPDRLQAEVLDFVAFLLSKPDHNGSDSQSSAWKQFSLDSAMRDIGDDDEAEYDEGDVRKVFS